MITFLIGLAILFLGGAVCGRICERVMQVDDTPTPATRLKDGIEFLPMGRWRNCLIGLLNIAGTGPILGSIQGILFGPVAFLAIPIGCVIGGAFHDYMSGMISLRYDGKQMPELIRHFLGKDAHIIYYVFIGFLLFLGGAVFIYMPGDLFVGHILKQDVSVLGMDLLAVYGVIFVYYLFATLLPIDKIIGRIYPFFGALLLVSAVGIFFGLLLNQYPLKELWEVGYMDVHPLGAHLIPIFFITVGCGILSGAHATQVTIISRTLKSERDGRWAFLIPWSLKASLL